MYCCAKLGKSSEHKALDHTFTFYVRTPVQSPKHNAITTTPTTLNSSFSVFNSLGTGIVFVVCNTSLSYSCTYALQHTMWQADQFNSRNNNVTITTPHNSSFNVFNWLVPVSHHVVCHMWKFDSIQMN